MSMTRRNDVFPALTGLFDDFFTRDLSNWSSHSSSHTVPAVNIRETHEDFEVEMAAPGMTRDDFKVELEGNLLTITSEKQDQKEEKEGRYTRKEFSYRSFQRAFQLPKNVVDADKIEAKYENGVLRLMIPKKEEVKPKPPKTIQIN